MRYDQAIEKIENDERYKRNVEYGKPRDGHPEGKVKSHIKDLENNLELIDKGNNGPLDSSDYWKLMFLIHTHDTFKAEAKKNVPILDPNSHASLARAFASEFTDNEDILNMIQYHDENYALYRQYESNCCYNVCRFNKLIDTIKDWRLFLIFTIIDGCTEGKDREKVKWFIREVNRAIKTDITEDWTLW